MNESMHARVLREARAVLQAEATAIASVAERLNHEIVRAAVAMLNARFVFVSGVGKSGDVGQKIAGTLTSLGTPAVSLCPMKAMHGDLGLVGQGDLALLISRSGRCDEIVTLANALRALHMRRVKIVAITGCTTSPLAALADIVIDVAVDAEASLGGLAPTCSTAASLAVGDALAVVLESLSGFSPEDFRRVHPGGELGRPTGEIMHVQV